MQFISLFALVAATLVVAAPLPAEKREPTELYGVSTDLYSAATLKIIIKEREAIEAALQKREAEAAELYSPLSDGEIYPAATLKIIIKEREAAEAALKKREAEAAELYSPLSDGEIYPAATLKIIIKEREAAEAALKKREAEPTELYGAATDLYSATTLKTII